MKSLLYWAARTYRNFAIADKPSLSVTDLVEPYAPYDLAALLGLMYLYKKLKRRAQPEDWAALAAPLHLNVDIGGFLGDSMVNIGFGNGILVGAIRHLSIATILIHDKKGVKEYRIHCKMKRTEFDPLFEFGRWGCTHAQISSILIQSLGFGISAAEAFSTGLGTEIPTDRLKKSAYMARIAPIWIQSLRDKGIVPDMVHRGDFYPLTDSLNRLLTEAKRVKEKGSRYTWLDRSKDDISPETTPQLFGGTPVTTVDELETDLPEDPELDEMIDEE